ncbi:NAD(P)/FAD-dependent oxidoreductase [Pengzhenrongella sicca]|uniref:FAD-dependent oxidoreductase n=1 Tax=Pengzhenrongella sicca TaxID=2819238 RepID=A0A8A4ZEX3_9MICO|nr:FAD-dependent oxidoreductase [Pengzhenrongella sicca]QTE29559.1 FAD-dependent oxidoreductase [Pengzhenrongella sicca]
MASTQTLVIVGASLAGAIAAQTLRQEGFDGRVVLVGAESHPPYERPPLSKSYLQGSSPRDDVFVHAADWYTRHDIELRLGVAATSLDRVARTVTLAGGETIAYDRLLLATGSVPRLLEVPGATADGVRYLRTLDDSEALRAAFAGSPRVVVIGAGWIGLETAAAARAAGLEVTVLEAAELPLLRVLGPELARVFADLHREHGVDLRLGAQVTGLRVASGGDSAGSAGGADGGGSVTGVELGDGSVVPADLVIVGIGVSPAVQLAADAGLDASDGIRVDEYLRSPDPAVFAAGDVASAYHPRIGRHLRVEHWENARRQGVIAARSMIGERVAFDRQPYFFTDQYDLGMEYVGHVGPEGYDELVVRGDLGKREFIAFWLGGGRVLAGMNVNVWDVVDDVEALISRDRSVDPRRLADLQIPLAQV